MSGANPPFRAEHIGSLIRAREEFLADRIDAAVRQGIGKQHPLRVMRYGPACQKEILRLSGMVTMVYWPRLMCS